MPKTAAHRILRGGISGHTAKSESEREGGCVQQDSIPSEPPSPIPAQESGVHDRGNRAQRSHDNSVYPFRVRVLVLLACRVEVFPVKAADGECQGKLREAEGQ